MGPLWRISGKRSAAAQCQRRARLEVECLEDRCVPSTATDALFPASPPPAPFSAALGPGGRLWFAGGQPEVIGYRDANGHVTEFAAPPGSPGRAPEIAVGTDGNLWFTEGPAQNLIGRIDPLGHLTTFAIPSGFPVQHIAFGPDGNLWFLDAGGAGWIDPSNGVVMEYTNFGVDFSRLSFAADGGLLLGQGPASSRLDRGAFLSLFVSPSGGFPGGGGVGGSLTVPAVVLTESFANGIIALPTGFAVGPAFVANLPKLSSAVPPTVQGIQGVPFSGSPPPVPGYTSEQIVWMSLADHGVRGAYSSARRPVDSSNRLSNRNEAPNGSPALPELPPTVGKISTTGSGTMALADADSGATTPLLAGHREKVNAVVTAIFDGYASSTSMALGMVAAMNEDVWRLAGWLPPEPGLPVPHCLAVMSWHESDGADDQTDVTRIDPLLSITQVQLSSGDLETVPEKSALLGIAQEYRRHVGPMVPERKEVPSKSRLLVRLAAAWLVAQSVCFGVGRKGRHYGS